MNPLATVLTHIYSRLLLLYPRSFQNEFAEEMQIVFRDSVNEADKYGIVQLSLLFIRELGGLPFNILREFWYEHKRKDLMTMDTNENTEPNEVPTEGTSHWNALIGALPFVLFGIASMIGKLIIPFLGIYANLAFYVIVLLGLLIGLVKGVPRWTYSYLGWSLVFTWWWTGMGTYGLRIFGFRIDYWTWQIWIPLLAMFGIAMLWTRSLLPFRQLVAGIWQDWTLLSLVMYTFIGWMTLIYDENRHPYLFAFMTASTLVVSAGAWFFLRNRQTRKRIIVLLSSFMALALIGAISDATWDWRAYYGLPPQPPVAWYVTALRVILVLAIWSAILFWPVLVGLARRNADNHRLI